jgi:hypothetical protein
MLSDLKSETGYILVSAGNAIADHEIKARYFYKTQQEARQSVKPSYADSLVEIAKVEGYREVQGYFNSSDTVEMLTYLQEYCGCRVKLSSLRYEE